MVTGGGGGGGPIVSPPVDVPLLTAACRCTAVSKAHRHLVALQQVAQLAVQLAIQQQLQLHPYQLGFFHQWLASLLIANESLVAGTITIPITRILSTIVDTKMGNFVSIILIYRINASINPLQDITKRSLRYLV